MSASTRLLADDQLAEFDTEYIDREKWPIIKACIERDLRQGFTALDIGGGNGAFADRILAEYPSAHVTVLDNSEMLLAKNKEHPRKTVLSGSALGLSEVRQRYDLVCMNWLLHHLVGDTHAASLANIHSTINAAARLLKPGGRVSVYENMFDGLVVDGAPGRIIYELTSMRSIAPLIKWAGANTAGVGVCFRSERQWRRSFAHAGLQILAFHRHEPFWRTRIRNAVQAIALHLRPMGAAHFWAKADQHAVRQKQS